MADAILLLHFAIVLFITSGFILIPLGAGRRWKWVRHRGYRLLHLLGIAFVALEALVGLACPLTVWEDILRGQSGTREGFIERWVGALLYWDLPMWVFTLAYVGAAGVAMVLWRVVPPAQPHSRD